MSEEKDTPRAIVEYLKSLGLTKYEGLVYIALLQVEGATASGIHELSDVPRASVYPVLDRLVQKSLARISNTSPRRFAATPPKEGIKSLLSTIGEDGRRAEEMLQEIYLSRAEGEGSSPEQIWSISGADQILTRAAEMISGAKKSVEVLAHSDVLSGWFVEAVCSLAPGVRTEVFTDMDSDEITGLKGVRVIKPPVIIEHHHAKEDMAAIFIIDRIRVLVMMGNEAQSASGIHSEAHGFVTFFCRYYDMISGTIDRCGFAP